MAHDCKGNIVAPGFVDVHTHSDLSLLTYPANHSRIRQGITTEILGNCGMTPAPTGGDQRGLENVISTINITPGTPWAWSDVQGWMSVLAQTPTTTNFTAQVGHSSARFKVAGEVGRPLSEKELDALEQELDHALDAGCVGVSIGLMYTPGEAATALELQRVAQVVAARDALLSVHLRNYQAAGLIESIDEVAAPARNAGARLQISHLRMVGNGTEFAGVIEYIEDLRTTQDIAADAYPYVHGHTTLLQLLPTALRSRGTQAVTDEARQNPDGVARLLREFGRLPEQIVVMKAAARPDAVGMTLAGVPGDPFAWVVQVLVDCEADVDVAVESGNWADVDLALRTPWVSIASDGAALNADHRSSVPHPRSWGTFPSAYRHMRTLGLPIGEIVHRMTDAPARRAGLSATIAVNQRADVIVFDDDTFTSSADFAEPAQPASGLHAVMVGGEFVFRNDEMTQNRPGRLLSQPPTERAHV
ncbi:N-acyl-D-amino-acid deacylase family protein [Pseudactinotalea sp. Z1748]|uniref:N-acyl-D-amino-acid deacylase family protein n=1 Tax=Pseudactinotalea sp. Z1748 TaxID=3413027 RepID=UPI003C7DF6FE